MPENKEKLNGNVSNNNPKVVLTDFLPPFLSYQEEKIIQSILENPWKKPSRKLSNRLVITGDSFRNINSASIPLNLYDGKVYTVNVATKELPRFNTALKEQFNLEQVNKSTKIPTVRPFACLQLASEESQKDQNLLLTFLEKGVVPLQKIELKSLKEEQIIEILLDLGVLAAGIANNGVIHRDFRPRNIGIDLMQRKYKGRRWGLILFDLESATVLDRITSAVLNSGDFNGDINTLMEYNKIEMETYEDIKDLVDELKNELPTDMIKKYLWQTYLRSRLPFKKRYSEEAYTNYVINSYADSFLYYL